MSLSRLAVKRLTPSDLSFFSRHLRRSKQKAINLNADIFVDKFYPGLRNAFDEIHFPLTVIGPKGAGAHVLSRKAVRSEGGKNWRLDGEIIHDPEGAPRRYANLRQGDFALIGFEGEETPRAATLVLVGQRPDPQLHAAISQVFSFRDRHTMLTAEESQIFALLETTRHLYPDLHPLEWLLLPDSIEEAIYGSSKTQTRTAQADGLGVVLSRETLKRQVQTSEQTGRLGEEVFARWLGARGYSDDEWQWVSVTHARAAYDFLLQRAHWAAGSGPYYVDVKATRGSFSAPIYVSMAETRWSAANATYRIARVHELASEASRVTILSGLHDIGLRIVNEVLPALPRGIVPMGFELDPAILPREYEDEIAED